MPIGDSTKALWLAASLAAAQASGQAELPRIPWEGGPEYWRRFPKAAAAGWTDPSFFPIVVWYNGFSSDAEVKYDKGLGINTYIGLNSSTQFGHLANNGMFYIGGKVNASFEDGSPHWVGRILCDECEVHEQGAIDRLRAQRDGAPDDGRFHHANYSKQVIGPFGEAAIWEQWVNLPDAVSIDMHYYTLPPKSFNPYYDGGNLVPVLQTHARTASSYGKNVKAVRLRDAADGKLGAVWHFVENLNGGPGEGPFHAYITPGQLQGAVMNALINEARGILYFNSSLSGTCFGNPIFRMVQYDPGHCAANQVAAAKEINLRIRQLAPVLNTQSFACDFGPGLNTMLKRHGGHFYLFAMIDGSTYPGARTLTLPGAMAAAKTAEVLFEDRTVPISGGRMVDNFDQEHSYRIYKIEDPAAAGIKATKARDKAGRVSVRRTGMGWTLEVPASAGPISLYSASGRRLARHRPGRGRLFLGHRDAPAGIHFLRFEGDGSVEVVTFTE